MFKVKITILLISILVVSTKCDDDSIEVKEPKECPTELPDYINAQLSVVDYLGNCFNQIGNMTNFKKEIGEAETEENVNEIVKKACLKKDQTYDCVENRYVLNDECYVPPELIELRESLLLQTRNVLTHFCDNDGLRLRNFFNDKGTNCIIEKSDTISNCSTNHAQQLLASNGTVAEKCDGLKKTRTCAVEILQTCETQGAAIFIDEFLHLVLDEHICKNKEIQTDEQNT